MLRIPTTNLSPHLYTTHEIYFDTKMLKLTIDAQTKCGEMIGSLVINTEMIYYCYY